MTTLVRPGGIGVDDYRVLVDTDEQHSASELLAQAVHTAEALSTARCGSPHGYSLLFHGPHTRAKPLPHVHIVLASDPPERIRRLQRVGMKRWIRPMHQRSRPVFQALERGLDALLLAVVPHPAAPSSAPSEALRARLQRVWTAVGASGSPPYDALIAQWSSPSRHYHGIGHLTSMLTLLDAWTEPADRDLLELAIWFHDAILVPMRSDNELRSANWARQSLASAGASHAAEAVYAMVMATRSHQAHGDWNTAILLDLDLAALGASPEVYAHYRTGVRQEFARVPERMWRKGRARVLRSLIDGGVYQTPAYRAQFEAQALRNLSHELTLLTTTS